MNLPNRITITRIVLSVAIMLLLLIPWHELNVSFPDYVVNGNAINLKYIITGAVFMIASLSDFLDGHIARSRNMVTDFGKVLDAIADKILVNGLLIIMAYDRMISVIIPVVIITRDIITDTCKMVCGSNGKVVAASKLGKLKTIFMMTGITLVLFGNIPFTFINVPVDKILVLCATLLSVISGIQYYNNSKKYFLPKSSK